MKREIIITIVFFILLIMPFGNEIFIRIFGVKTEAKILEIKEIRRGIRYLRIDVLVSFVTTNFERVEEIYSINCAADMVAIGTQLYAKLNKYVEISYIEDNPEKFTIISPALDYVQYVPFIIILLILLIFEIIYL